MTEKDVKAQEFLKSAGLERAWELYASQYEPLNKLPYEEATICDIVGKLVKWGSISSKQVNFLNVLLNKIDNRAKWAAEKAAASEVPEGRRTLPVEVLKTEVRDTPYGPTPKMLVKAINGGFTLWGTVPAALSDIGRGEKIELTATIKRSENDSKFGFFSRPYGSRLIAA